MLALDADESMKQMFLPQLAMEAIAKKNFGKARVVISIQRDAFRVNMDKNLNFLMSASKFLPNLDA